MVRTNRFPHVRYAPSLAPGLRHPRLARPFRVLVCDWSGTLVSHGHDAVTATRSRLDTLLELGVWVVLITDTTFHVADQQISALIRGIHKQRLYICSNGGAEVHGFDLHSRPMLLWRSAPTAGSDVRFNATADRTQTDCIHRPDWSRPGGHGTTHCLTDTVLSQGHTPYTVTHGEPVAVGADYLRERGLGEDRAERLTHTAEIAQEEKGQLVPTPPDGARGEAHFAGRADAMAWVLREIVQPERIVYHDLLVVGDEFGPSNGQMGRDASLLFPELRGATFVSVGPERAGVPAGVMHLGGGATGFQALLDRQITTHERALRDRGTEQYTFQALLLPPTDHHWMLEEVGFHPAREHEVESLFTVANGYLATRGSLEEGGVASAPAAFVAGVFDRAPGALAVPELVVTPSWTQVRVQVEGEELALDRGEILEHRRILDLRRGVLLREWHHQDPTGRITRLRFLRFASLANRHLAAQAIEITPENYTGRVCIEAVTDGRVCNNGGVVHLTAEAAQSEPPTLVLRTLTSGITISQASVGRLLGASAAQHTVGVSSAEVRASWTWDAQIDRSYLLERVTVIATSREVADPAGMAAASCTRLGAQGIAALLADHEWAWRERWDAADVAVHGDESIQRALRVALYHLISAANPDDERVSVGARALTGQAYRGHVFWDTCMYMLPFYILTWPEAARALLLYRYHTLPAARAKAHALGYRGALYAWESADTGEETTPPVVLSPTGEIIPVAAGSQEHHITADVAYAVWQYWQGTGDDAFFQEAGAEIVLEAARFWASRAVLESDGRFHIRHVVGPDEYHEGVDDNAYTNMMARWVLERGSETVRLLRTRWSETWERLAQRLDIHQGDPATWAHIAAGLTINLDACTGILEQFAGFFTLENLDLAAYEPRTVPMDVLLGRERIQRAKVIKQADVVLLLHLLPELFPPADAVANFRYYEPLTGHGSSLSPAIHAAVAARLGEVDLARRYVHQTAAIDLANNMGNAAGGVHAAALGGLWQAVVCGFAGLDLRGDTGLALDPHLPPGWQTMRFPLQWRGSRLHVTVRAHPLSVEVVADHGRPVPVGLGGQGINLEAGRRYRSRYQEGRWLPWEEVHP